jgi:CBS domain-containing protein
MALMSHHNVRHLPVVQDETLLGMLSIRDVVRSTINPKP